MVAPHTFLARPARSAATRNDASPAEATRGRALRIRRLRALLLTLVLFTAGSFASAEAWTIQTAAVRDYRMALERATALREAGFNAYTEFTMRDGQQYVRIRVGCFTRRSGAEQIAQALRSFATDEAVAVPLSAQASVQPCVHYETGFLLPDAWGVLSRDPGGIVFWIEIGDRRGYMAFDGRTWRVIQNQEEAESLRGGSWLAVRSGTPTAAPAATPVPSLPATFARWQGEYVQARVDGKTLMIGRGDLLWEATGIAVVRLGNQIAAVRLVPRSP